MGPSTPNQLFDTSNSFPHATAPSNVHDSGANCTEAVTKLLESNEENTESLVGGSIPHHNIMVTITHIPIRIPTCNEENVADGVQAERKHRTSDDTQELAGVVPRNSVEYVQTNPEKDIGFSEYGTNKTAPVNHSRTLADLLDIVCSHVDQITNSELQANLREISEGPLPLLEGAVAPVVGRSNEAIATHHARTQILPAEANDNHFGEPTPSEQIEKSGKRPGIYSNHAEEAVGFAFDAKLEVGNGMLRQKQISPDQEESLSNIASPKSSFNCDNCNMSFGDWQSLCKHNVMWHSRSRTFGCNSCSSSLPTRRGLALHKRKYHNHPTRNPPTCASCRLTFQGPSELHDHRIAVHPKIWLKTWKYACPLCGKKFVAKGWMNRHLKDHERLAKAAIGRQSNKSRE